MRIRNSFNIRESLWIKLAVFCTIFILLSATCITFAISYSKSLEFVSTNGQSFFLNGHPFRFVGVNRYNLLSGSRNDTTCGESWSRRDLDQYFSEMRKLNINVVRFWAFQYYTKGTDFSTFDYLLTLADKYNIKLIPVLENQWANCTEGEYKYSSWYRSGYLSPYGNYHFSFVNYVKIIVSRYSNRPEIMMWQIMNEAESKDVHNSTDFSALYDFAKKVSSLIKSLDPNHLINLGTIGSGQPGTQGSYYRRLYELSTLDVLDYHDYNDDATPLPNALAERLSDARVLNKPLIVDEAGITNKCVLRVCYSQMKREEMFNAKMTAFFNNGGAGYLIWSYRDNHYNANQTYEFNESDPLAKLIQSFSERLSNKVSNFQRIVK
jgi:mannan endo-1,4-beta-mannosidase